MAGRGVVLKSPDEIERMSVSNQMAATVRDTVSSAITAGMTTGEVDAHAARMIKEMGAKSAFLGYSGFPGHICISVNEEIVHGIGGERVIEDGDIVSVDFGVTYDGFIGDTAVTAVVGDIEPEVARLLKVTEESLYKGIDAAVAGNRVGDISNAIEQHVKGTGFSIVREFVGHGVGHTLHEEPQIPNFGPAGRGELLQVGMTLAIEPMVNLGKPNVEMLDDGWTVVTKDRKPSAHFEHTVAITEEGPRILTIAKK